MAKKEYVEDMENPYDPQKTAGENFKAVLRWAFRLRSVALAIPVAVIAVLQAVNNAAMLPGSLEFGTGSNVMTISKAVLVMGPLALTALCLLMTLCSKRVVYPWLISLFSLLLPVVVLITTTFGI